ncbi:c-type cytochrome [Amycolatopsis cynarae]|uniref:C-type cytochrome n=1 Tax=Amycolatopsis cynarae TaxID=2995223 RepID=A0ABY7BDS2_9PSEU|nr:c-type cytochrome [Amycolatopsis sp. HUAS 11-8]WAL69564.1 c-type cytochrome [Amycolatopsis sp. HUAS 11-8]
MYLARHRGRRSRRLLAAVAVLGFLLLVPALTASGDAGTMKAAGPGLAQPAPDRGRELYQQNCASCHGPAGQGTQRGPSLVGTGPASVDFQLSTGRMPLRTEQAEPQHQDAKFGPADIQALVAYVAGFGPGGPPIPQVGPGDLRTGQEAYLANCAACHSSTGVGGPLTGGQVAPALFQATPTQIAEAVRVGPLLMPAFTQGQLPDDELNGIIAYLGYLQGKQGNPDPGGLSLGRIGPITEGAVGWGLGLLLVVLVVRRLGSRAQ